MASSTEYNMLFKLSAQLSQEFGTTFSSAKKSLNDTQKEIQALNKQQADISAYQKQQQAVDSTSRKLADLKKEYENIQREIQNTEGFSSSLENKLIEKKAAIDKASASLAQQTEKLDQMGEALRDAGVDTSNLGGESEKLKSQIDDLADEQARLAEEAENAGEKGKSAFSMVGDALIAAGIAKGLKEIYEFTIACADGSAKYADNILTMSAQYNIAAKDLQAYYYASELVDVSVETMTSSITKNTKSMYNAADGSKQYVEAYEKLGISVTDANGNIRDGMEVYWEVIDALGAMENETERDGIAMTLLGRSAMQLNTLIEAGSGVMGEYAEEAQKAGYILSDDVLAVCGKLDDAEQIQKNNLIGLKNTLGAQFAPELTAIKELENGVLEGLTKFTAEHPVIVKSIIAITAELSIALALYKGIPAAIAAVNTVKTISNALKAKSAALTAADAAASGVDAAAKTGQAAATTAATAAQTGLNAAMMANPIGLVLAGVAALTVGVIALADAMKKADDSQTKLTARSQAQYDKLQKLDAEYKKACKVYGETSYEAQSLKWEIDELSEEYESGKQTVQEFSEEIAASAEEAQKARDEYARVFSEIDTKHEGTSALIDKLDELTATSDAAAKNQAAIIPIVNKLNEAYSNFGVTYDTVSGKLNMSTDEMRQAAKEAKDAEEAEAAWAEYVNLIADEPGLKAYYDKAKEEHESAKKISDEAKATYDEYTGSINYWLELIGNALATSNDYSGSNIMGDYNAYYNILMRDWLEKLDFTNARQEELNSAQAEYEKTAKRIKEIEEEYGYTEALDTSAESAYKLLQAVKAVRGSYMTAEEAASLYDVSLTRLNAQIEANEATEHNLSAALKVVEDGFMTVEEASKAYGVAAESITAAQKIDEIVGKIGELSTAYNDVKEAAEKSIQGQYSLWDTAAVVIPSNIDAINTSLETQLSYWSDYNTDLANLLGRTGDVEGLSEVIASFADGSEESVNAIAGMAAASDEDLRKMVKTWHDVKQEQQEASEAIAEIATGFGDQIDGMRDDLEDAIESLNLDDESEAAAKETVNAYVAAIKNGTSDAVSAAERLSQLVSNALNASAVISVVVSQQPASAGGSSWKSYEDAAAAGYSNIRTRSEFARGNNSDKQKYGTYDAYLAAMQKKYTGYASGTDSALPGFALVGEEGPELVSFRGGEQVYTADQTKALLADYKAGFESLHAYASGTGEDVQIVMLIPLVESLIEVLRGQDVEKPQSALQRDGGQNVYITVSPSFTVESGNDDLEERLRSFSDIVTENVMNALDEAGIDAKRGAYV